MQKTKESSGENDHSRYYISHFSSGMVGDSSRFPKTIKAWVDEWTASRTEEAYHVLVEHLINKAKSIGIELSRKYKTNPEDTTEEALLVLSQLVFDFQGNYRSYNCLHFKLRITLEKIIQNDPQQFRVSTHASIDAALSRQAMIEQLHITEWEFEKYYDYQAEDQPREYLLEEYRDISPFEYIPAIIPREDDSILVTHLRKAFLSLSFREQYIVVWHSGILNEIKTLNELGHIFRITRERIRQLEDHAIKRLQYRMRWVKKANYDETEIAETMEQFENTIHKITGEWGIGTSVILNNNNVNQEKSVKQQRQKVVRSKHWRRKVERVKQQLQIVDEVKQQRQIEEREIQSFVLSWLDEHKDRYTIEEIAKAVYLSLKLEISEIKLSSMMTKLWIAKKIHRIESHKYGSKEFTVLYYK